MNDETKQIYGKCLHSYIPLQYSWQTAGYHKSFLSGKHGWQHNNQVLVGLLAQLLKHCTGIAEGMGSNPVQA